jgi:hypothetical protein
MRQDNSRKNRVAVLVAALAALSAVAAFAAATAAADDGQSADIRTITGSFCNDATHAFCLQASFGSQTVEGYCAGTISSCTPNANSGGTLMLRPGDYLLSVNDSSKFHDFTLRSCPDSTAPCDESSGGTEQPITTDPFVGSASTVIHLSHGTYRLFCGNDGPPIHEDKGMYVDISVGGVGQLG